MKIDLNKNNNLTFENLKVGDVVELKTENKSVLSWYAMKSYHEKIGFIYIDLEDGEIFQDYENYPIVRKINAILTEKE